MSPPIESRRANAPASSARSIRCALSVALLSVQARSMRVALTAVAPSPLAASGGIFTASVEVYGEYSTIRTEEMEKLEWRIGLDKPTSVENFANLTREEKWGFAEEDRLFVDAILNNAKPPVTSHDGLKSVEMTIAVYKSAKEKTAVRLEL